MVTNLDGHITQNVVYIPFGEVFVEERNGTWASPYLFNAKELDDETGLYYYNARYLEPLLCGWLSVDKMWEDQIGVSPYNYCLSNPVKLTDPDGNTSKASEFLKSFGFEINSFGAGVIDGLLDASPLGLATFVCNLTTDENFRSELYAGLKYLAENPVEAFSTMVETKADAYNAVLNGTATDEQKYEVGCDIGNTIGSVLGGGIKSLLSKFKPSSNQNLKNVIYLVPGEATISGKPYIGRSKDFSIRMREKRDGRDRTKATIVDHYDPNIPNDKRTESNQQVWPFKEFG